MVNMREMASGFAPLAFRTGTISLIFNPTLENESLWFISAEKLPRFNTSVSIAAFMAK
ncbi:hypothetical protein D3C81_2284760 [compost metagenome]